MFSTNPLKLMFGAFILCSLAFSGAVYGEETKTMTTGKTLENLQAAFNGESNAHAKYLAFADKAKQEGYLQVAALFNAAAKAEEIHANGHAKVIKALGAEPKANVVAADVKTTLENLKVALEGETYEKDVMYPEFVKQAEADGNKKAKMTFRAAMLAEVEHARMYSEAIGNIDAWKAPTKKFIVCAQCGYTTDDLSLMKCPVCGYPRSQFIEFQ